MMSDDTVKSLVNTDTIIQMVDICKDIAEKNDHFVHAVAQHFATLEQSKATDENRRAWAFIVHYCQCMDSFSADDFRRYSELVKSRDCWYSKDDPELRAFRQTEP